MLNLQCGMFVSPLESKYSKTLWTHAYDVQDLPYWPASVATLANQSLLGAIKTRERGHKHSLEIFTGRSLD